MTQIFKNAGAVFSLKVHLVWCPKYRRPVLVGKIEKRLRQLLYQTATEYEWVIEALEIMRITFTCWFRSTPVTRWPRL